MIIERMEMSASSKGTMDQRWFEPQMAQIRQAASPLLFMQLRLLTRSGLMGNESSLVPWAIGWQARIRLLLNPKSHQG